MNKIWAIEEEVPYTGCFNIGYYSSKEKAEAALAVAKKATMNYDASVPRYHQKYLNVIEIELDQESFF